MPRSGRAKNIMIKLFMTDPTVLRREFDAYFTIINEHSDPAAEARASKWPNMIMDASKPVRLGGKKINPPVLRLNKGKYAALKATSTRYGERVLPCIIWKEDSLMHISSK